MPESTKGNSIDIGDVQPTTGVNALFSDATLILLSNKNNPVVNVFFRNIYPVSLGALDYNQQATDVEYLTVEATFSYQIYEIETIA